MSYNETPAYQMFPETSVVLRGYRKQDEETLEWEFTEAVFYLRYDFDDASISLGIYDNATRSYLLETEYAKSAEQAIETLQLIDADFPEKLDAKSLSSKFELFFKVAENAVYVNTPVTDTNDTCDQCGDYNVDTLRFLYVPALEGTEFSEGSLDIHWEYGCYGGKMIEGSVEDYREIAVEMLDRAKSFASSKKYRREIQKAIVALNA